MYWCDEKLYKIEMYDLMTGNRTVLFQGKGGSSKEFEKGKLLFTPFCHHDTVDMDTWR